MKSESGGLGAWGHHRDTFYEVRLAFQVHRVAALVKERRGPHAYAWLTLVVSRSAVAVADFALEARAEIEWYAVVNS